MNTTGDALAEATLGKALVPLVPRRIPIRVTPRDRDGLDIVLMSNGLPHDGDTLTQRSLGGSETAAIRVARALAQENPSNHVTVFSPCQGGMWDGVTYRPINEFPQYVTSTPHDVSIVSRDPGPMRLAMNSKFRVLWCHDLALKRARQHVGSVMWNIDAIFLLSEYQRQQYIKVYDGVPTTAYVVTRNGVDTASMGMHRGKRDIFKVLYGSRPERGLDQALNVFEILGRRGSPLVLHVAWYDNPVEQLAPLYQTLWGRAQSMPNVKLLGPLKQSDWHKQLGTAAALIYPHTSGYFREISCIVAMEAQVMGCPVVAAAKGALPETLTPETAALVGEDETDPNDPAYHRDFADALEAVTGDKDRWLTMSRAGIARQQALDWSGVADQWMRLFRERISARSADSWRLERHCARLGDSDLLS